MLISVSLFSFTSHIQPSLTYPHLPTSHSSSLTLSPPLPPYPSTVTHSTSPHSLHLPSLHPPPFTSLHLPSLTPPTLTSLHLPPPPPTSHHLPPPPLTSLPLFIVQVPPVKWLFRSDLNQTNTAILCPIQDLFSRFTCRQQGTHRQRGSRTQHNSHTRAHLTRNSV